MSWATIPLLCCITIITGVSAPLIEGPVSVSALVGENALFHCNGSGIAIVWRVDGSLATDAIIIDRGITRNTVSSSGTVQSNLTVPATLVNNGTTVQCVIYPDEMTSNNATLTVIPGIGPIANLTFNPSGSAVLWDPPATAGVLSGLSYIVIVMNNNTGQVILNETTNHTRYPQPFIPCQYYTVNVTAFSSQHRSESVFVVLKVPGEYYIIATVSQPVVYSYNSTHCSVVFTMIDIQQVGAVVCPDQKLMAETYPVKEAANRTPHPEVTVMNPGVMQYNITIEKSCHCASDISIFGSKKDPKTIFFSSYNVQDCDVSSDNITFILVECTFAINSTAPGIVVIQDDQSQYHQQDTLQRLLQDSDKGSVNITGLPAGEYSVRVYDNSPATDSTSAAYQHSQLIHIMAPTVSSINKQVSSRSVTVIPSMVLDSTNNAITITLIILMIVFAFIGITTCIVCIVFKCRRTIHARRNATQLNGSHEMSTISRSGRPEEQSADLHHSNNPPAPATVETTLTEENESDHEEQQASLQGYSNAHENSMKADKKNGTSGEQRNETNTANGHSTTRSCGSNDYKDIQFSTQFYIFNQLDPLLVEDQVTCTYEVEGSQNECSLKACKQLD